MTPILPVRTRRFCLTLGPVVLLGLVACGPTANGGSDAAGEPDAPATETLTERPAGRGGRVSCTGRQRHPDARGRAGRGPPGAAGARVARVLGTRGGTNSPRWLPPATMPSRRT